MIQPGAVALVGNGPTGTNGALELVAGGNARHQSPYPVLITPAGRHDNQRRFRPADSERSDQRSGGMTKVGSGVLSLSGGQHLHRRDEGQSRAVSSRRTTPRLLGSIAAGTARSGRCRAPAHPRGSHDLCRRDLTLAGSGIGLNPGVRANFLMNRAPVNNNAGTNTWTGNITLNAPGTPRSRSTRRSASRAGALTVNGLDQRTRTAWSRSAPAASHSPRRTRSPGTLTIDSGTLSLTNSNTYTGTTHGRRQPGQPDAQQFRHGRIDQRDHREPDGDASRSTTRL